MRINELKKIGLELILAGTLALFGCQSNEMLKPSLISATNVNEQTKVKELTDAEKLFLGFPENIPKAKVKKYPIYGSKYLLVHIRSRHLREKISDEDKRKVKAVQNDIYSVLSYLVENYNAKEVYGENIAHEDEDYFNLIIGLIKYSLDNNEERQTELKKDVSDLETRLKESKDERIEKAILEKKDELKDLEERYEKAKNSDAIVYDAVCRLALEGKIDILASVSSSSKLISSYLSDNLESGKIKVNEIDPTSTIKRIMDDREDSTLEIITKQDKPIAILVYGGLHAFGGKESCGEDYSLDDRISYCDNIAEWNKKHPEEKMSLIEITPESYR